MARPRDVEFLKPLDSGFGRVILKQAAEGPVYVGTHATGREYLCGVCRKRKILENVVAGELVDIAFRCSSCGGLSEVAGLPSGDPLPYPVITLDPGEYFIGSPLEGHEWPRSEE